MKQQEQVRTSFAQSPSLAKPMLIGAAIGFILIIIFLLSVGEPDPRWPKFWMVRPLTLVTLAGACGGLFYHLMNFLRRQGGWKKIIADLLSAVVFIIGLWLGSVLGLDGTLWN